MHLQFNNRGHLLEQIKVRYFKSLVYTEKALARKRQGFIIDGPN